MSKPLEIVFFARGGQGAKTAAEIMAQSALKEGKYVQAFPSFGPERSGAPIHTYLRIADSPIRTKEPILEPDILVVVDPTLIQTQGMKEGIKAKKIIINTNQSIEEVKKQINVSDDVCLVDANGISQRIIGQVRPNTVILGALTKYLDLVKLESVKDEFRRLFAKKIGEEETEKNIQAIEEAAKQ